MSRFLSFATLLTLIRLILSPLMLPVLIVYLAPYNNIRINVGLAVLFTLFSLTDFFDGYFARKYKQVTLLGKVLDPIADKCLVYSVLIALLAINKIFFVWVIILVGRDFFMMGLRQVALEHGFSVSVSWLGKIKTAVQFLFLIVLLLNPYHSLTTGGPSDWVADFWRAPRWMAVEAFLLLVTLVLALWSMINYYRIFVKYFLSKKDDDNSHEGIELEI